MTGSVPSLGAEMALWACALLTYERFEGFAGWIRAIGIVGSILFAITSARIFWGEAVLPTASPLPFFAYPFLVLTFACWIWTLVKAG